MLLSLAQLDAVLSSPAALVGSKEHIDKGAERRSVRDEFKDMEDGGKVLMS